METEELKVEYLVLMDNEGAFCDCKESFNKLLQVSSDIKINNNKLKYKGELDLSYFIANGEVEGKDQRFFQISFCTQCNEEKLDHFVSLLKDVRTIIIKYGGQPEVLRDDISTHFAQKAYPVVHRIENMMRKLIANFMLRKVGKGWLKETAPETFKQAIDKSKRKDSGYMNALYQVDFIHLADFLFKPYSVNEVSKLFEVIGKATKPGDLDIDALKEYIPKSNWHRYFSDVVDCDDSFLDKRWKDLYELRCIIAHNSIMTKQDYLKVISLVNELEEKINKAINEIDKITVPTDDQEVVAESVIASINILYGEFIRAWKNLESTIRQLAIMFNLHTREAMTIDGARRRVLVPRPVLYNSLSKMRILPEEVIERIIYLQNFRNQLMHADEVFSNSELEANVFLAEKCALLVYRTIQNFSHRQAKIYLKVENKGSIDEILRVTKVFLIEGNEESEQSDFVSDVEFSDRESLVRYISQELAVPEANIEIIGEP